jgi:hypothetical protein
MKKINFLGIGIVLVVSMILLVTGCNKENMENPLIVDDNSKTECGECPSYMPPAPGWCSNGTVVAGEKDSCGCQAPPKCQLKTEELVKHYCTEEQKNAQVCTMEYLAVCGWYFQDVQCIKYPCAIDSGNPCTACATENVEYWTEGECPK